MEYKIIFQGFYFEAFREDGTSDVGFLLERRRGALLENSPLSAKHDIEGMNFWRLSVLGKIL